MHTELDRLKHDLEFSEVEKYEIQCAMRRMVRRSEELLVEAMGASRRGRDNVVQDHIVRVLDDMVSIRNQYAPTEGEL
jgi:elongation factor P--beta-lysine ligase